jgi:hypothetical protein
MKLLSFDAPASLLICYTSTNPILLKNENLTLITHVYVDAHPRTGAKLANSEWSGNAALRVLVTC